MPPAKFKPTKKTDRKGEALARLRRKWQEENPDEEWEAEKEPKVSKMFRAVEGGMPAVLEALRAHDADDAQEFIALYDATSPSDRKFLSLEDFAYASGIGSLRLAELAQTALYLYASAQTKLLISSSMVKVTSSIVKAATDQVPILDGNGMTVGRTNGDVKAMELFGRISGIAPVPKGAQIAIQNNYGERATPERDERPALSWRSAEDRLKEFQDMTEPKRLPSPESKPFVIGGHIDRLQEETVEILRGE